MQKAITLFLILLASFTLNAQKDYSKMWEDVFSYNYISNFTQTDTEIIALTDNAFFIYDKLTAESQKISSINGLSGETTSAFYYDTATQKAVIGYENGLVEIIDKDFNITSKLDILNFGIVGSKRINHIAGKTGVLYVSLPFGIVTLDLDTNDFGDTYFIGENSSEVAVNEIEIHDNKIYAATSNGLYIAALDTPFLVDSNNWNHQFINNFSNILTFDNQLYLTEENSLYKLTNDNLLTNVNNQALSIKDITKTNDYLCVTTEDKVSIYNTSLSLYMQTNVDDGEPYQYKATTAQVFDNKLYIGTQNFGILQSNFSSIESFTEIHPEGPISNQIYSFSILNNHIWIVYGGHNDGFAPLNIKKGASHFNGENWITIPYRDDAINMPNLSYVSIDPSHENRVYISSYIYGMLVLENDEVVMRWDDTNTPLERGMGWDVLLMGNTVFDKDGNLWISNMNTQKELKKYSTSGEWSSYDISELRTGGFGTKDLIFDNYENLWIGNVNDGAWAVNSDVTKKIALKTAPLQGALPHVDVRSLAVDSNNTIWIGTRDGLVTFNASSSFFDKATYQAKPVVIASGEDDGFGVALLGKQKINAICIDGANNKWFGTETGGVLYTNPTGRETFLHFDKSNSPLPSNKILKIIFDENSGKVYFATDKGMVAFDSNIVPYGEHLTEVYAYPNPVRKNHDFVTIDGRNGNHIPDGTNIKILDAAGRLVYETNVVSGQEKYGGKVTWNKTNLAGRKVASGVYIVLLSTDDASETSMTKIAIIN
jgi:ligand-binding sensor domain-containing protein